MANMMKFFGLCINMRLVCKKNVADYCAKNRPSTYVPSFAKVTSFRLFAFVSRVLHAGDPDAPVRGQDGFEPWNKVRPILDATNLAFKSHYVPPQHASIDESMVGMNRVAYIHYAKQASLSVWDQDSFDTVSLRKYIIICISSVSMAGHLAAVTFIVSQSGGTV